ncbi:Uncharacterised protein [Vibrio cholerae]|nr:Uncharacterised protein [Vibrio cholerae]
MRHKLLKYGDLCFFRISQVLTTCCFVLAYRVATLFHHLGQHCNNVVIAQSDLLIDFTLFNSGQH